MQPAPVFDPVRFAARALGDGLVTPDQLAAAIRACNERPDSSLDDELVRAGAITVAQRVAIEDALGRDAAPAFDRGDDVTIEQPGRYENTSEAGFGGQAVVLMVTDRTVGREVAMKVLRDDTNGDDPSLTTGRRSTPHGVRFLREARVTAQLEHPNIVPVHEVGRRADGSLYYTMRLVRGRTLADALKECAGLPERLRLLKAYLDLCHAIAFAHSRGVVHRDIKPANVMVGEFGETVVLDWGIAKVRDAVDLGEQERRQQVRLHEDATGDRTAAGLIGTPAYMSPEQAAGDVDRIDHRSDVWSLGVVLFQLLTGQRPFKGDSEIVTLVKIVDQPVPDPLSLCPQAPRELVAVALRALGKKQEDRYQSARELAADVEAYLTGGRVRAYEYSSRELVARFARQNKASVAAAGLVLATVVAALVLVSFALRAQTAAREREAVARVKEHEERLAAGFHLAQAYVEKANRLVDEDRHLEARLFAAASLDTNPAHPRGRAFEPGYDDAHPEARELRLVAASTLFRSEFSPQVSLARRFTAADALAGLGWFPGAGRVAAASSDGLVTAWSIAGEASPVLFRGVQGRAYAAAVSPDGATVAGGGQDRKVYLWNARQPDAPRVLAGAGDVVDAVHFSPDGALVAAASRDGFVRIWDVASGSLVRALEGRCGVISDFSFSPDGQLVAGACANGRVPIWRHATGALDRELVVRTETGASAATFSPDGATLAVAGADRVVRTFEVATGRALLTLAGHRDGLTDVTFSPDGRTLASSSYDRTVRLWDAATGRALTTIAGHEDFVFGVAFSPDGRQLATTSYDKQLRVWALAPARALTTLRGHTGVVYGIAFTADGKRVTTTSWDESVRVWDAASGAPVATFAGHTSVVDGLAVAPDGRLAATSARDKTVRLWDLSTLEGLGVVGLHEELVSDVAFSPDGRLLVSGGQEGKLRVFDVAARALVRTIDGHGGTVNHVAFSPDGALVASSSHDRTARLWNAATGALVRTFADHTDWVSGLAFSPDGRLLATGGKDAQVLVHAVADGRVVARIAGHRQWVNAVRFSPDGRLLASASDDATVRITELASGRTILRVEARAEVAALAFAPDGQRLAMADGDDVVLYPLDFSMLDVEPAAVRVRAERAAGQVLDGFGLRVATGE